MSKEKYLVEIDEGGDVGLDRLDYCYNPTTKQFLLQAGLKPNMTVLDIGCGSGVMTVLIAKQIAPGKVIAIENNENQLNAAKERAKKEGIQNIEFKFLSAYDIDTLKQNFDLVYCRFVLHHLQKPMEVIQKIYQCLKPNGIYVAEEGIVNFSFSYPFSSAWGDESLRLDPVWAEPEENVRDGNIGIKMFNKMHLTGFKIIATKIVHPLLTTRKEKKLMLLGREQLKQYFLDQGHTEAEWIMQGRELEKIIENDAQILGFYASCQVAGYRE